MTVAITGKGGVGKTSLAALTVRRLIERGAGPVLAVDADPNTCLDELLGVRAEHTIGAAREEAKKIAAQGMSAGVDKQTLLEMKIAECLVERDAFDLLAMGRPEGPGCYCYANNVLGQAIRRLADSYPSIVVDCEAGLENLSRRIVKAIDLLVVVSDPSRRGLRTARRLHGLAGEMDVTFARLALVVNRLRGALPDEAKELGQELAADAVLGVREDDALAEMALRGGSVFELPGDSAALAAAEILLDPAAAPGAAEVATSGGLRE